MLYTENPKDITRKLLDLVNESGNFHFHNGKESEKEYICVCMSVYIW